MTRNSRPARLRGAVALVGALTGAMVLASCGSGSSNSSDGKSASDATLRIAYTVNQSLDPREATGQLLISTWPVYDRLLQVSADSTYEPMLATSWKFSETGKVLTLELRKDVTFSDGTPFNAEAVKANVEWAKKATGSAVAASFAGIASVEAAGEFTAKLNLVNPGTQVLSAISAALGGIMVSPKALDNKDLATHPVGTGAYVIESSRPGQQVVYKRRTDEGGIWDPKTGKPARITITTMAPDAQVNALRSGQVDLSSWSADLGPVKSQVDSGQLQYVPLNGVLNMVGVNFDTTVKPFDNPLVRKAVNFAINRKALVNSFMPPGTAARVQPWPRGLPGFSEAREESYSYDPAKAKALLQEAGLTGGVDAGLMLSPQVGTFPQAAQAIQADLAAVGIEIRLQNMDVFTLVTEWAKSEASAEFMYMSHPSIEANAWLQRLFINPLWTVGGGSPEVQRLVAETDDLELSTTELAAKVDVVIQYGTDEALYAPIYQGVGGVLASPKVKNLDPLASVNGGVGDFRNVYLTK